MGGSEARISNKNAVGLSERPQPRREVFAPLPCPEPGAQCRRAPFGGHALASGCQQSMTLSAKVGGMPTEIVRNCVSERIHRFCQHQLSSCPLLNHRHIQLVPPESTGLHPTALFIGIIMPQDCSVAQEQKYRKCTNIGLFQAHNLRRTTAQDRKRLIDIVQMFTFPRKSLQSRGKGAILGHGEMDSVRIEPVKDKSNCKEAHRTSDGVWYAKNRLYV